MRFLDELRDPRPRLKPGLTWSRLLGGFVVVVVLALVVAHALEGHGATGDCGAKEIDRGAYKEGTCEEGGTTIVVVDRHGTLGLSSLEARLLGVRHATTLHGPAGSRTAHGDGVFLTFDVALTNRTGSPATVGPGQFALFLGEPIGEDTGVDQDYEPRSFLAMDRAIASGRSEDGTVTFTVSSRWAKVLNEAGNFDVLNFGSSVSRLEPEGLYTQSEYGVIRTYK